MEVTAAWYWAVTVLLCHGGLPGLAGLSDLPATNSVAAASRRGASTKFPEKGRRLLELYDFYS